MNNFNSRTVKCSVLFLLTMTLSLSGFASDNEAEHRAEALAEAAHDGDLQEFQNQFSYNAISIFANVATLQSLQLKIASEDEFDSESKLLQNSNSQRLYRVIVRGEDTDKYILTADVRCNVSRYYDPGLCYGYGWYWWGPGYGYCTPGYFYESEDCGVIGLKY